MDDSDAATTADNEGDSMTDDIKPYTHEDIEERRSVLARVDSGKLIARNTVDTRRWIATVDDEKRAHAKTVCAAIDSQAIGIEAQAMVTDLTRQLANVRRYVDTQYPDTGVWNSMQARWESMCADD